MSDKDREVLPVDWPVGLPDLIISPFILEPLDKNEPPCAFDNIPPGIYGLVCYCPRCTTYCLG